MRLFFTISLLLLIAQQSVAPPVTKEKKEVEDDDQYKEASLKEVEYHRYLKEVVQVLESDPDFRSKLEKAEEADIRTGKIAHELEFASHHVRTKLDELKRTELDRLKRLHQRENELQNHLDLKLTKVAEHVDHQNPHTFEVDDLKKLIEKTTKDLEEVDRKRKEEFKEYEMQKKFEEQLKLKGMNPEERKKYEGELHAKEEKHKKHEPLHHPGSKQQLEEVWEKKDHMENQNFDPRTFFMLHDLDGNDAWDQYEVQALFSSELDKLYATGSPNQSDLRERAEEMERMREHVFKEADHNRDGFISYDEFLAETKKPSFQKDQGWEPLDEQQIYSQKEYEEFERQRQEEIRKMIEKGLISPYPDQVPHHEQQFPGHGGNYPAPGHGGPPPNAQYHPQPDHYQGQAPPQHYQGHPNEIPQQMHHGQVPPMHDVPPQHHMPQQHFPQGQVPPQHHQGLPDQQVYHQQQPQPEQQQHQPQQYHQPEQHHQPEQQHHQPEQQHHQQQQQHHQPEQQHHQPEQQHHQPEQQHHQPEQQHHQLDQQHHQQVQFNHADPHQQPTNQGNQHQPPKAQNLANNIPVVSKG